MPKLIDLTGQKFGRLTVISRAEKDKWGASRWLCLCDCEKTTIVPRQSLKSGRTKSCGCLVKELADEKVKKMHQINTKHNLSGTRIYRIWNDMKQRCTNSKQKHYENYGGRGITVCKEWSDNFVSFYRWAIDNGYAENLSIDRIDNNKGYSPDNCRWATRQTQTDNRRCSKPFILAGVTYKSRAECARQLGISSKTLKYRARKQKEREGKIET